LIASNAEALGIDLSAVDTVALSHGHYDHVGGLADVLRRTAGPVTVYGHPAAFQPKYRRYPDGVKEIGMPGLCRAALQRPGVTVRAEAGPVEIADGVHLTGAIPRLHAEERGNPNFRLDPEGALPDPLEDDQALYASTPSGTLVLLGCAHAGVINTLDYIRQLTGGAPLRAVLGGMHLRSASPARLAWTIAQLRRGSIEELYPAHCTGAEATAALWAAFPGRGASGGVGVTWPREKSKKGKRV
jgi:7,8-dihydropterin-6-yl-methyl-4-(beta-D-ribofuranosyl)aminobenzene 5'-phosphate synthase